MPDVVPIKLRSRIMSRIRAKNTQIELEIRRRLFVRGFRYRIHRMDLPGTPDIVFPKYRTVIFVHGCLALPWMPPICCTPDTSILVVNEAHADSNSRLGCNKKVAKPRLANTDHLGVRLSQTSHNPFQRLGFYFGKGGEISQFYPGVPGNS